jgi:hypothetical protein
MEKGHEVLVGDCGGADKCAQQLLASRGYGRVTVFAAFGKPRNNIGNWPVHAVDPPTGARRFGLYASKDLEMAKEADWGFMIWDGESKGTLNNMLNLSSRLKPIVLLYLPDDEFHLIHETESLEGIIAAFGSKADKLYLSLKRSAEATQLDFDALQTFVGSAELIHDYKP